VYIYLTFRVNYIWQTKQNKSGNTATKNVYYNDWLYYFKTIIEW
jgi:hypothetical protein